LALELAGAAITAISQITKAPRVVATVLVALVLPAAAHAATLLVSCETLGKLALPDATVALAETVATRAPYGNIVKNPTLARHG
jgi:hypothetical protein